MASGLLFMASGLQNSLHIGCWQEQYWAGTGAWFMLVAGTVLGTGLGSSWWQAQYLEQDHVGTWQEHDLAHVGGRHNTLVKGYTAGFK